MKQFLVIALVAAAAIVMAIGMNRREKAERNEETRETVAPAKPAPAQDNDNNAVYRDLDLVRGSSSKAIRKDYTGFRLAFNPDNRTPEWVAWELLGAETDGPASRSDNFWQDQDVENCPTTGDYARSGYDRGHLCPAADQKWSTEAMNDCFVMTNICPQDHSLNSGAWNTLENKERNWAARDSAIVIVAGPIYEPTDTKRIGRTGVRVPSAFYKVLLAPYVQQPRSIAFIYPNMSSPGSMENYVTTVDEVEKLTGLDFFYNLPDSIEDKVEAVSSFRDWNRRN